MQIKKNQEEIKRILDDINAKLIDIVGVIDYYVINQNGAMRGTKTQADLYTELRLKNFGLEKGKRNRDLVKLFKKDFNEIIYYIDFGNTRLASLKIEAAEKSLSQIEFFSTKPFLMELEKIKRLI